MSNLSNCKTFQSINEKEEETDAIKKCLEGEKKNFLQQTIKISESGDPKWKWESLQPFTTARIRGKPWVSPQNLLHYFPNKRVVSINFNSQKFGTAWNQNKTGNYAIEKGFNHCCLAVSTEARKQKNHANLNQSAAEKKTWSSPKKTA